MSIGPFPLPSTPPDPHVLGNENDFPFIINYSSNYYETLEKIRICEEGAFFGAASLSCLNVVAAGRGKIQKISLFDHSENSVYFWRDFSILLRNAESAETFYPQLRSYLETDRLFFKFFAHKEELDFVLEAVEAMRSSPNGWLFSEEKFQSVAQIFRNNQFTFQRYHLADHEKLLRATYDLEAVVVDISDYFEHCNTKERFSNFYKSLHILAMRFPKAQLMRHEQQKIHTLSNDEITFESKLLISSIRKVKLVYSLHHMTKSKILTQETLIYLKDTNRLEDPTLKVSAVQNSVLHTCANSPKAVNFVIESLLNLGVFHEVIHCLNIRMLTPLQYAQIYDFKETVEALETAISSCPPDSTSHSTMGKNPHPTSSKKKIHRK